MVPEPIDSTSVGDAARFPTLAELERAFATRAAAPASRGRIALIVRRRDGGRREMLERIAVELDGGIPGDAWERRAGRDRDMAIAVMQLDVAELIANGQPLPLFGDNLFVDLDLSIANLPAGSRLRTGDVVLEVTPAPHNGCRKFRARFGDDALRFVATPSRRARNLRGIYVRVVAGGELHCGDVLEVMTRAPASSAR